MKSRRPLTPGERKLARYIFKHALNVRNIEVRETRLKGHAAVTPFGSIYFPTDHYRTDFLGANMYAPVDRSDAHWFVHELVHVWQHYVGMRVVLLALKARIEARKLARTVGTFSAVYGYSLHPGTDLLDYSIEQQGDIIADYFAATLWRRPAPAPMRTYEGVLKRFLADPAYPVHESRLRAFRSKVRGLDRA